jgi:hypothetical protein
MFSSFYRVLTWLRYVNSAETTLISRNFFLHTGLLIKPNKSVKLLKIVDKLSKLCG